MHANRAKEALKHGDCVYGTSLEYCLDPEIPILLAKAGLDLFFIDTEHTTADYGNIRALCRTARDFGITPMVRVTQNEAPLITRALDCGAMGIVVPRVHSPEEARFAVSCMKYPPVGRRGFGMHSIMTDFEWRNPVEMMEEVDRQTLISLQVESREGLDSVEATAAVPGVDVLFVGPYDLTISMGIAEQFSSREFWGAVDRVVSACAANGIAAGIQTGDMNLLLEARRRGVRFLLYGSDYSVMFQAYRRSLEQMRSGAAAV
jgi:2-dehydro-3-deoxyglucarate aldolase/4-hydroxy-2-oxoheptanedioate aldolase